MKYENAITTFVFLLITSLFLFFVSSISSLNTLKVYGEMTAVLFFIISLFGLFVTSLKMKKNQSTFYYLLLFLVLMLVLTLYVFEIMISTITQYYLVLAILIALLLSIIDLRSYVRIKKRIIILKNRMIGKLENTIENKNANIQKHKQEIAENKNIVKEANAKQRAAKAEYNKAQKLVKANENKIAALNKNIESLKEKNKKLSESKKQVPMLNKKLKANENKIALLQSKISTLSKKNGKLKDTKKEVEELEKSSKTLERKLAKKDKEIERQAELKSQYSKTLRGIRKRKKEEEELLVVSPDGKSVHRPKCISVRHITKDNRKLIKNWKTANKEGYKGCKLCNPHIKPKVIRKGDVKYKFVGSKDSDKVHKASCLIAKNIETKDRVYFRTYRAALKKGYTSCRVCITDSK